MKLAIAIIIFAFSAIISGGDLAIDKNLLIDSADKGYIYFLASQNCDDKTSRQFCDAIVRYTKKYGLQPRLIARQIFRESHFILSMKSERGALGACQLQRCHDKLMMQTEKYNPIVPIAEQYFYIYPPVEMMCMLMASYAYQLTYDGAIVAYLYGGNSSTMTNYLAGRFDVRTTCYWQSIFVDGYIEKKYLNF